MVVLNFTLMISKIFLLIRVLYNIYHVHTHHNKTNQQKGSIGILWRLPLLCCPLHHFLIDLGIMLWHAVFLINRMPSKILQMISPFEKFFHKKPDLSTLKVFGSAIYPYLRHYNAHKFQPRSTQCIFLGYISGYKGSVCFNKLTNKLLVSRNVIHDETCFPFAVSTYASSPIDTDMVYGTFSSTRPIVVQLGTNITMPHNSSQSATQFHSESLKSPLSSNMSSSASISNSSSQDLIQHSHISELLLILVLMLLFLLLLPCCLSSPQIRWKLC